MRHSGRFADYLAIVERCKPAAATLLRHDLCGGVTIAHALDFAKAEAKAGLQGVYFLLPTELYWSGPGMTRFVEEAVALGHTCGLHHASIAQFLRTGEQPAVILRRQLDELRKLADVTMIASHGSPSCYDHDGKLRFVEYEVLEEFDPRRNVGNAMGWPFNRVSAAELGVVETYVHGEHDIFISDSGGTWHGWSGDPRPRPFERYPALDRGLAVLDGVTPKNRIQLLAHPVWFQEIP